MVRRSRRIDASNRQRHDKGRGTNVANNREFYAMPKSENDAKLMFRFNREPELSPVKLNINGNEIPIPKYNGAAWGFPATIGSPIEKCIYMLIQHKLFLSSFCRLFYFTILVVYMLLGV